MKKEPPTLTRTGSVKVACVARVSRGADGRHSGAWPARQLPLPRVLARSCGERMLSIDELREQHDHIAGLGDCFVGVRLLGAEHTQYSGAGGFNGGPNLVPAQPLELIE